MGRLLQTLFNTGIKIAPPPPGAPTMGFPIAIPQSPTIFGKKLFDDSGPGYADPAWRPLPETTELPECWSIDERGFFTCRLPRVSPTRKDFREADCAAFPHPLTLYRLSFDRTSFECMKLNANYTGLRFHHWMGKHVPGFWDVFNYRRSQSHSQKVIRLVFEGQGEIILYGTHGKEPAGEDGAKLEIIDQVQHLPPERRILLYIHDERAAPDGVVCYPEHRHEKQVSFLLPSRKTARAIITAFAAVGAIGEALSRKSRQDQQAA